MCFSHQVHSFHQLISYYRTNKNKKGSWCRPKYGTFGKTRTKNFSKTELKPRAVRSAWKIITKQHGKSRR